MSDLGIERATPLTAALALGDDRRLLSDAGRLLAPLWRWTSTLLIALLLPAALVAVWSLAVRWEVLAPQILPAPSLVWQTLVDLVASGQLFSELAVSLGRVAAGVLAGGLLGLGFGIAFGVSRRFEAYVSPTVRAIFLVPSLGWLPFFMLIFGIGETLKIVLIAKTCFLPPMVNAFDAIRALPDKYRDVARVLELDRRATLRYVVLPAVLPAVRHRLPPRAQQGLEGADPGGDDLVRRRHRLSDDVGPQVVPARCGVRHHGGDRPGRLGARPRPVQAAAAGHRLVLPQRRVRVNHETLGNRPIALRAGAALVLPRGAGRPVGGAQRGRRDQ